MTSISSVACLPNMVRVSLNLAPTPTGEPSAAGAVNSTLSMAETTSAACSKSLAAVKMSSCGASMWVESRMFMVRAPAGDGVLGRVAVGMVLRGL